MTPSDTPPADTGRLEAQMRAVAPFADGGVGDRMFQGAEAYLEEYVLSREDGPDHEPTEFERELLEDFLNGMMSDERFFGPVRALLSSPPRLDAEAVARIIRQMVAEGNSRALTERSMDAARAICALTLSPAPVEVGDWVLVPREPTEEMIMTGARLLGAHGTAITEAIYLAMISAAPNNPTSPSNK